MSSTCRWIRLGGRNVHSFACWWWGNSIRTGIFYCEFYALNDIEIVTRVVVEHPVISHRLQEVLQELLLVHRLIQTQTHIVIGIVVTAFLVVEIHSILTTKNKCEYQYRSNSFNRIFMVMTDSYIALYCYYMVLWYILNSFLLCLTFLWFEEVWLRIQLEFEVLHLVAKDLHDLVLLRETLL